MGVVDTSLLVDLFDESSPSHARAKARVAEGTLRLTPGVIGETTQAVRRQAGQRRQDGDEIARRMLAALRSLPGYSLTADADDEAIARLYAANPGLSYVDAWGIWLARKTGEELWTHDKEQARAFRRAL